ncbi:MAG: substrate-binding domain-containing protein [Acidimicrobiales bacterium]|jgi:simple sugar transport system substrate-binding protein
MPKYEHPEVNPKVREVSRRRFLRNAGLTAAAVPFMGTLGEILGQSSASASSSLGTHNPWPHYPAYKFAMVCHVTADPFFVSCREGANDMCALLGVSYTWTGSETDIIPEMVDAFTVAINDKVDGIACCMVDPTAFNAVTNRALGAGIPVTAYNAEAPVGAGNNAMCYIGQDLFDAGVAVAKRILTYVKKGDLVGGMISVPGSLNEQPRMDGAASVFKPAGIDFVQVGVGATEGPALASIEAWYQGHQDVKFMFSSGGSNGVAVATAIQKLGLAKKGIGGAAFDVGVPVLDLIAKGQLAFTVDQQAYLQGACSIYELFLYNITGGLITPVDVDTGFKYVDKSNVSAYVTRKDSWEGSSTTPVVYTPPASIKGYVGNT